MIRLELALECFVHCIVLYCSAFYCMERKKSNKAKNEIKIPAFCASPTICQSMNCSLSNTLMVFTLIMVLCSIFYAQSQFKFNKAGEIPEGFSYDVSKKQCFIDFCIYSSQ